MKIVGGLGFAPETFYNLKLKQCLLIIDGSNRQAEQNFFDMSQAVINGIGCTFGDKKFKFINPYESKNKEKKKPETNKEQALRDIDDLKKMFNK